MGILLTSIYNSVRDRTAVILVVGVLGQIAEAIKAAKFILSDYCGLCCKSWPAGWLIITILI